MPTFEMSPNDMSMSGGLPRVGMPMGGAGELPPQDTHQTVVKEAKGAVAASGNESVTNQIARGAVEAAPMIGAEIGRASCRERVCQYV